MAGDGVWTHEGDGGFWIEMKEHIVDGHKVVRGRGVLRLPVGFLWEGLHGQRATGEVGREGLTLLSSAICFFEASSSVFNLSILLSNMSICKLFLCKKILDVQGAAI
jgi:hypothetical protein